METGQMNEDRIEKLLRETKFPNERHKELLRVKIQREELEMSNKAEKLKEILADKELAKELAYLETSEAARGWFAEHGLDLTDEEVDEIGYAFRVVKPADKPDMEVLDLDELADVAGGVIVDTSPSLLTGLCNRDVIGAIGQFKYDLIRTLAGDSDDRGDDKSLAIQWGTKGPRAL
jgi:hypothetical protein